MNKRLSNLGQFVRLFAAKTSHAQQPARKLYTDHIYPYPFKYMNEVKYPSQALYRETWPTPPMVLKEAKIGAAIMKGFWTWFFYNLFHHPEVLTGHTHLPDPSVWTDADLGIPPDDVGSYRDWLEKKYGLDQE